MGARQRKEKAAAEAAASKPKPIPLKQPDRTGPTEQTLYSIANERNLFAQAEEKQRQNAAARSSHNDDDDDATLSPGAERFLEAMLWTATLAMLHFTFDVLVQNQYGTSIDWPAIWVRTARAWIVFVVLFYPLHPHESNPTLLPFLPLRYQRPLRQVVFFAISVVSGCSLIYVTNTSGYLATMKRAPPLGCLWLWAVVELDLLAAAGSLLCSAAFLWHGGYEIK